MVVAHKDTRDVLHMLLALKRSLARPPQCNAGRIHLPTNRSSSYVTAHKETFYLLNAECDMIRIVIGSQHRHSVVLINTLSIATKGINKHTVTSDGRSSQCIAGTHSQ